VQSTLTTRRDAPIAADEAGDAARTGAAERAAVLRARVVERVASGKVDLPLLPQVAGQVLTLAGNANTDAAQLSGLIHRDPALAGQVLRIANSAAYLPRMPIVSLQQAVARLGLNAVTEIALVASMQSGTFRVPGYEADLKRLWRHAIASALFGKEIARLRRSNVEAAFLCGLLHAIGKPALLQLVADIHKTMVDAHLTAGPGPDDSSTRATIRELLDELHTGVGLRIARMWGLPRPVVAAIATYACYGQTREFSPEALITCLADRLATDLTEPECFTEEALRDHPVFGDLNLYPVDVTALLAKRTQVSEHVESMTAA